MAESEEEMKSLLMKVKVESEKVGLKLNIQKTIYMSQKTHFPRSWFGKEYLEVVMPSISEVAYGEKKIKASRSSYQFKPRDITLPTKVHLVKAMLFPVVIYGCESWTVKKAECQGIDAFELWCWRKLLWVPWTARRSNQSILKEISPECSLEGLMLKLKL